MRVEHPRGEGADDEGLGLKRLLRRGRLVNRAGDRLEVIRIEGERVKHPIPADYVERMIGEHVARQPRAVLDDDARVLLLIDDEKLARPAQVALVVWSAEAKLAIAIQIPWRDVHGTHRLDAEHLGFVD